MEACRDTLVLMFAFGLPLTSDHSRNFQLAWGETFVMWSSIKSC